jgi:hypothetical protein
MTSAVMKSTIANDSAAMGVITTKPGQIIGGADIPGGTNAALLALTGRVPVKVSSLNGFVKVGDPITSSNLQGIGMKQLNAGKMVGRIIEQPSQWNTNTCTVVNSLEEANNRWPNDTTGANSDHPCFAIPTQNVAAFDAVPSTYTNPYVFVGKVMMKVENNYNDPGTFNLALEKDGHLQIAKGATVNPSDLAGIDNYYLTDEDNNILTNSTAFSNIESANGTFGSLTTSLLTTPTIKLGNSVLAASETGDITLTNNKAEKILSVDSAGNAAFAGSLTTKGGTSIAQDYPTTDTTMHEGDVISLSDTTSGAIQKSTAAYDNKLMGVYSAKPGILISEASNSAALVPVALSGQAMVTVNDETGAIHKGDFLTSSSTPGVAMKSVKPGIVLGRAMGDFSCGVNSPVATSCVGKVLALINVTFADPKNSLAQIATDDNGNILVNNISTKSIALGSDLQVNGQEIHGTLSDGLTAISESLSNTSVNLNSVQTALAGLSTGTAVLDNRVTGLEAAQASISAQLVEDRTATATTASAVESLTQKVQDIFSSISAGFAAPSPVAPTPSLTPFVASSSAQLGLDSLAVNSATVSGVLNVLGRTTVTDLGITGRITSGLLSIDGLDDNGHASINSVGSLRLQSNAMGGIDILSGKVIVDTYGNVTILKSITAGVVNTQKLNITADTSTTSAVLSASAGVATVAKGTSTITIPTTAVNANSLIYVTFSGDYGPAIRYWIDSKTAHTSFTLKLDATVANSVKFNWWIVN